MLADNVIRDSPTAIRVSGGSGDTIIRNILERNVVGITLAGGSSHRVYHNRFLFNGLQAEDSSSATVWDDGYPSGGNWWSDYAGDDLYSGLSQTLPGPDGFGDTPYVIDADSRDRYPFYSVPAPGVPRELTATPFGGVVRLTWRAAPMADAYDMYTASTPTGFDFASPIRLGNVTAWVDFGASTPGPRYYVVRGHSTTMNRTGSTSNTAGAWTTIFPAGPSTLSLPFAPYPWIDYSAPGWFHTMGEFATATGASLAYMEAGRWRTVPGDGDTDRTLRLGEGYVADVPTPTWVTFVGLPGAMIDYADWPPYPLRGFDPATTAREVTATVAGDDVVLEWTQLPDVPLGNGTYRVHASRTPAGFHGYLGVDYDLLATVDATAAGTLSYTHVGALRASPAWYYRVVPVRATYWRGASTYSVGVAAESVSAGYSAIGLPLQPYANGTYLARTVSYLSGPGVAGLLWFDASRGDWVAHAAWMPPGTYDAPFTMIMAVQVDVAATTRFVFVGV